LRLKDNLPVYFTSYQYGKPVPVFRKRAKSFDIKELTGKSAGILLVTGIANNKPLKEYLAQYSDEIAVMSFPDHHYYNRDDIRLIKRKYRELKSASKIVITTEKDAVRFREYSGNMGKLSSVLYYVPIEVKFLAKGEKPFIKRILKHTAT
jgi:tetraacyldisaccharide 4'-kinase